MSFSRSWRYGLGGFVVGAAAMAGFVAAMPDGPQPFEPEAPTPVRENEVTRVAARDRIAQTKNFPAFAPDGVIIVRAPLEARRQGVEETLIRERAGVRGRVERRRLTEVAAHSVQRASEPPQTSVLGSGHPRIAAAARFDSDLPRTRAQDEPTETASAQNVRMTETEMPAAEYENASSAEIYADNQDNRSWYRSPAYWRDVERRRRAAQERN